MDLAWRFANVQLGYKQVACKKTEDALWEMGKLHKKKKMNRVWEKSEPESNCHRPSCVVGFIKVLLFIIEWYLYKKNGYNEMKFDIIAVSHQSSLEFGERIINCENN